MMSLYSKMMSLKEDETSGMLDNIQVRTLLCFMYNRAVLKGNIYYLHS